MARSHSGTKNLANLDGLRIFGRPETPTFVKLILLPGFVISAQPHSASFAELPDLPKFTN
jgi:hypothetical protein